MMTRHEMQAYIDRELILRGSIPMKNGDTGTWLFRLKRGLADPEFAESVFREVAYAIVGGDDPLDVGTFQVAGVDTSGALMALGVSQFFNDMWGDPVPAVFIRKERRSYGELNLTDGGRPGLRTIIVDDFVNSGASIRHAVNTLVSSGFTDIHHEVHTIVDCGRDHFPLKIRPIFQKSEFKL